MVERQWGLHFVDYFATGKPKDEALTSLYIDPANKAGFVPRTHAAVFATRQVRLLSLLYDSAQHLLTL